MLNRHYQPDFDEVTPEFDRQEAQDRIAKLSSALNAMLTHFGMDEDEWSKPTFDQARAALTKQDGK